MTREEILRLKKANRLLEETFSRIIKNSTIVLEHHQLFDAGKHAQTHATSGSTLSDVGVDPITPYNFTWEGSHTFAPTSDVTPITIERTTPMTSATDVLNITASDFGYSQPFLTMTSAGLVGLNDDPDSHLVVRGSAASPLDVSGLVAWYKADSITTGVNGAFYTGQWDDSTGNGHDLNNIPSGLGPTYQATDAGGKPSLYYSSTSQVQVMNSAISLAASSAFTFIIWYKSTGINTPYFLGTRTGTCSASAGKDRIFALSLANTVGTSTALAQFSDTTQTTFASYLRNGTEYLTYHSFVVDRTAAGALSSYFDGTSIGIGASNTGAFAVTHVAEGDCGVDISLAEIMVYSKQLNATERSNVLSYLTNKYGGTVTAAYDLQKWKSVGGTQLGIFTKTGELGVGTTSTTIPAKIQALSTTEQLRLNYDASKYASFTVDSTGRLTSDAIADFVFSKEAIFNGSTVAIDLGTSGRIDSNVANGAGVNSVLIKPTVALTSGTDRNAFQIQDSAGGILLSVQADGSITVLGQNTSGSYIQVPATAALTTKSLGLGFNATLNNTGVSMGGILNACAGAMFSPTAPANPTQTSHFGIATSPVFGGATGTLTNLFGGFVTVSRAPGHGATQTVTNFGGVYVSGLGGTSNGTVTNAYGALIDNFGTLPAATLCHGIKIAEITTGASSAKYGILLNQSNTGYKALALRDANVFLNSDASGDLDVNATANVDFNLNGTRYVNFNTTTLDFGNPTSHSLQYTLSTNVVSFNGSACLADVPSNGDTQPWVFTSNRGDSVAKPNAFKFKAAQANANLTNHTTWEDSGGNTLLTLTKIGSLQVPVDLSVIAGATFNLGAGVDIGLDTGTGSKIGTATSQKLGFWNKTPVIQYATTGTVTGFTGTGGTAVTHSDTFTGNTGATAYTIGDIVLALKTCGIMAA